MNSICSIHWFIIRLHWFLLDSWVGRVGLKKVTLSPDLTRPCTDTTDINPKARAPSPDFQSSSQTQQLIFSNFVEVKWVIVKICEIILILFSPLQTQRRWTPSSISRSREVALLSVMWWWVDETCHQFLNTFLKLQFVHFICYIAIPCQVSVTQQYETNVVSNKKKRTLHHIGFAVYEVPTNIFFFFLKFCRFLQTFLTFFFDPQFF